MRSTLLVALAMLVGSPAQAEGLSIDVELMRPGFTPGGPPGVDSPTIDGKGAMRGGFLFQYQRDPVILYRFEEEYGVVVRNRSQAHFGMSYDITDRISARGVIPVALQLGFDENVSSLAWSGLGLGDLELGARANLVAAGPLTLGAAGDVILPIGTNDAWLGEQGVRGRAGLLAMAEFGPVAVLVDGAYTSRGAPLDTARDFVAESTLDLNAGALYSVWGDRLAIHSAYLARGGVTHLFQRGGENSSELIGGVQVASSKGQIDFGVGKGLAPGVGSSAFRGFAGWTWAWPPDPPPPQPVDLVEYVPPPKDDPIEELIEEPEEWKDDELARIVEDQIQIREPIQFEYATADILEESQDVLDAVAEIMNNHAEIAHIVIEGHASVEGSFEYNYDLSNLRARSIWKELMARGVPPERISYRGMGEVVPVDAGFDEESLATNRRVEFDIVERVDEGEEFPVYPETFVLPWSGDVVKTIQPVVPVEEKEKSVEEQLEELLNPDDFEFDTDEEDAP